MVKKALNVVILISIFYSHCLTLLAQQQEKYFLLDNQDARYQTMSYTLNAQPLYGIDEQIEIYNILPTQRRYPDGHTIILFSVLPDLKAEENWRSIDKEKVVSDTISISALLNFAEENSLYQRFDKKYGDTTKYFNRFNLVIKKDRKYFVAKNCLLQFYAVRNRPSLFNSLYNTINIRQDPVSIVDFKQMYEGFYENNRHYSSRFPLDSYHDPFSYFDCLRDRREYLSNTFLHKGILCYQFWTYTDWSSPTYRALESSVHYVVERGIDRFVYCEQKGIIGGSFDFYFFAHRTEIGLDMERFKSNIYEEKVMIAEELKK